MATNTTRGQVLDIDPVRYEVFLHRLWAIGEA